MEDNFHPQTRPGGGVLRKVGGVGRKVGNSGKGARCAGSVVAPNKNKKSRKNGSPFFIRHKKKRKSTDKKNKEVSLYKNTNKSQRLTSQQAINDESTRLSEPNNNSGTATQSSLSGYGEDPNNTIQAVKIMLKKWPTYNKSWYVLQHSIMQPRFDEWLFFYFQELHTS